MKNNIIVGNYYLITLKEDFNNIKKDIEFKAECIDLNESNFLFEYCTNNGDCQFTDDIIKTIKHL